MRSVFSDRSTSSEILLENIAAGLDRGGGAMSPEELVGGFLERTPGLTAGEQAELLGAVMETARAPAPRPGGSPQPAPRPAQQPRPGPRPAPNPRQGGGGVDWGRIMGGINTGLSVFSTGAQAISQFTQMFANPNDRGAQDFARIFGQIGQGAGAVNTMLQGAYGASVPPLPGQPPPQAPPQAPPMGAPGAGAVSNPPPNVPVAGGGGQFDATALLSMLLSNPQLQQALRSAPVLGPAGPRAVELAIPTANGSSQTTSVPLGAVMNTVMELARRAREEFNASTQEDDPEVPEYLVGEDGELIVDPANAGARAAAVMYRFRQAGELQRFGGEARELDESELWAIDAGFEEWGQP